MICNEKKNELANKRKIMSKRDGIFTENITLFLNAGKTGNVPEFEFDKFWKSIFLKMI